MKIGIDVDGVKDVVVTDAIEISNACATFNPRVVVTIAGKVTSKDLDCISASVTVVTALIVIEIIPGASA